MNEGTVFFIYKYEGKIVSAASAEMNHFYHNAEITDCATLPEHRKFGLLKQLILKLEEELFAQRDLLCVFHRESAFIWDECGLTSTWI